MPKTVARVVFCVRAFALMPVPALAQEEKKEEETIVRDQPGVKEQYLTNAPRTFGISARVVF